MLGPKDNWFDFVTSSLLRKRLLASENKGVLGKVGKTGQVPVLLAINRSLSGISEDTVYTSF